MNSQLVLREQTIAERMQSIMKLVITVLGADTVGIIAAVSTVLAKGNVNILTLKQTIIDGIFNMIIIGESKDETLSIIALQDDLHPVEEALNVQIKVQHMDIFRSMHQLD